MKKKDLKPYNEIIQICSECGKVDVYFNDNHRCDVEFQQALNEELMGL